MDINNLNKKETERTGGKYAQSQGGSSPQNKGGFNLPSFDGRQNRTIMSQQQRRSYDTNARKLPNGIKNDTNKT